MSSSAAARRSPLCQVQSLLRVFKEDVRARIRLIEVEKAQLEGSGPQLVGNPCRGHQRVLASRVGEENSHALDQQRLGRRSTIASSSASGPFASSARVRNRSASAGSRSACGRKPGPRGRIACFSGSKSCAVMMIAAINPHAPALGSRVCTSSAATATSPKYSPTSAAVASV